VLHFRSCLTGTQNDWNFQSQYAAQRGFGRQPVIVDLAKQAAVQIGEYQNVGNRVNYAPIMFIRAERSTKVAAIAAYESKILATSKSQVALTQKSPPTTWTCTLQATEIQAMQSVHDQFTPCPNANGTTNH